MKLSILIPITPERYETVQPLLELIIGDKHDLSIGVFKGDYNWMARWKSLKHEGVELVIFSDEKIISLGEKRERLYEFSQGEYSWQIDSDDLIAENAIELILAAIDNNPDCITFQERVTIDGRRLKSNFSHKYPYWEGDGNAELSDGFHFHRSVFYKCVIKTEIASSVPFPHIRYNEDERFAAALKSHIESEIHIDKEIYYYDYVSTPHNERYGIK